MPEFHTHGKLFVQKVFPYDLKLSHNTSVTDRGTDGQTDRRTDDNHANSSTVT